MFINLDFLRESGIKSTMNVQNTYLMNHRNIGSFISDWQYS